MHLKLRAQRRGEDEIGWLPVLAGLLAYLRLVLAVRQQARRRLPSAQVIERRVRWPFANVVGAPASPAAVMMGR